MVVGNCVGLYCEYLGSLYDDWFVLIGLVSVGAFFTSGCVLCDAPVKGKNSLCEDCRSDLPWMERSCRHCGIALIKEIDSDICGACQSALPYVDYTLSALHYLSPVDYLITELKFNHKLTSASILSDLLIQHLNRVFNEMPTNEMPELIIPVPLYKKRLQTRGFNQAVEIARSVAKAFSIPLCKNAITRTKNTSPQTKLTAAQRSKNIRNSFMIQNPKELSEVSHIVILDDVVTTGATCNELAKLLKKAGVETVGVWSIARA